jgi:hypothetical protein
VCVTGPLLQCFISTCVVTRQLNFQPGSMFATLCGNREIDMTAQSSATSRHCLQKTQAANTLLCISLSK